LEQLLIEDFRLNLSKIWKGIKGEKLGSLGALQMERERGAALVAESWKWMR
jgi:hypothetical protein